MALGRTQCTSVVPPPTHCPEGTEMYAPGSKIDRHGAGSGSQSSSYGVTVTIGPLTSPDPAS